MSRPRYSKKLPDRRTLDDDYPSDDDGNSPKFGSAAMANPTIESIVEEDPFQKMMELARKATQTKTGTRKQAQVVNNNRRSAMLSSHDTPGARNFRGAVSPNRQSTQNVPKNMQFNDFRDELLVKQMS